jgi:hypothetical protein
MRTNRRSLILLSTLLVVLAVLLSACGDDNEAVESGAGGDNAGTNDSGTTSGNDGDDAVVDDGTTGHTVDPGVTVPAGEPAPIEPNPSGTSDPRPNAWDDYQVSDDDKTLTFSFYMGVESCYSLDHVQVDETDTTVTVTIFTGTNPDLAPDTACIEIAELRSVEVDLAAPLDDREVVDGAV